MDTCSLQGEIVVELVVPAATDEVLVAVANQETTRPLMRYGSNTHTAFKVAYRITGNRDDAEDGIQDAWVKAYVL
jgi:RNA polymerase sigma-70 factor (ECF subfamily)